MPSYQPRGKYFEEFQVGAEHVTPGRTITEADIVNFAGLSGDYTYLHTDAELAKSTPFGERIAHGLLGLAVASGLVAQLGVMEGTVIAFMGLEWRFKAPIKIGDTIHVEGQVKQTKPMASAGGGLIVITLRVVNQRGEVTQVGDWTVLVKSRPAGQA